jgi:hypothetical protein
MHEGTQESELKWKKSNGIVRRDCMQMQSQIKKFGRQALVRVIFVSDDLREKRENELSRFDLGGL